jgi:hypothetical protein
MPFPFEPDEAPTKPEPFAAELRIMAERVLASRHADIAVLRMLRDAAEASDQDMAKYMKACFQFVERLLG